MARFLPCLGGNLHPGSPAASGSHPVEPAAKLLGLGYKAFLYRLEKHGGTEPDGGE